MDRKKKAAVWFGFGVLVLVLIVVASLDGQKDGEVDRYRTMTEITVAEGDRSISNKVYADCTVNYSNNWNTGRQIGTSHTGNNPFVVLSDRSILVLSDLSPCPGDGAAVGATSVFDPDLRTSTIVPGRIRVPYAHAARYDNIDDAKTVTFYRQQELFRGGIDGLRVTEAKLVVVERKPTTPLPDAFSDAFPWYKTTPRAPVGSPDYSVHDPKTRFSGFIVSLAQLGEKQRCDKFDREAEGPMLVTTDRWDECLPWGGSDMGWLIARPNADLSQIDYSYGERSTDKIATRYRATWLQARGVPGAVEGDEGYFFWRPKICIDGRCFATHAERRTTWEGFRLYYPKKNQVITVEWHL